MCLQTNQINTDLCLLLISSPCCTPSILFSCHLKTASPSIFSLFPYSKLLTKHTSEAENYRHSVRLTSTHPGSKKITTVNSNLPFQSVVSRVGWCNCAQQRAVRPNAASCAACPDFDFLKFLREYFLQKQFVHKLLQIMEVSRKRSCKT